jgi:3-deoxy-D-manno-octulosonic-acid transferase
MLREAERRRCPVLSVNTRVSPRTFRRFLRLRRIARLLLGKVGRFLVQTDTDRSRLESIGVWPDRIEVSGNLKCEIQLPELRMAEIQSFRLELGIPTGRKVLVAGSIHRGEEGPLLAAFAEARKVRTDVLLVLAPRHPEKFADMEKEFAGLPFVVRRRTQLTAGETWDILFLDTIGELTRFYAIADAAFIGGSLVPWGGQNLLEPAFFGKPIYFGPHMANFADLADRFVRGGGAAIVEKPDELADMFRFKDPACLAERGQAAKAILASLQGATAKTLAAIESAMPRAKG